MDKDLKSLEESLDEAIDMTMKVYQKNQETEIYFNKKENYFSISAFDTKLDYNDSSFQENPGVYIKSQIKSHDKYYEALRKDVFDSIDDLNEHLEMKNNIDRMMSLVPEKAARIALYIAKKFLTVRAWTKFKSFKSEIKKRINNHRSHAGDYKLIKFMIDGGNKMLNIFNKSDLVELTEESKTDLNELISLSSRLSSMYERLINNEGKKERDGIEYYNLFFPKEKINNSTLE